MSMHYLIQGIFAVVGLLAIGASIFNWDWFFQSQNTRFIVSNVGRKQARLFYALLGILMIATAVYFFLEVQKAIK
ncbi:MAG: immunity 17 family protein [Bacteroidaceae bacterium]|nr:immunity 17 family protein [Bacteroidaceae bacterium]MBQ4055851.1 immunity 17 family protein [Bacteroidaceae bacterium]